MLIARCQQPDRIKSFSTRDLSSSMADSIVDLSSADSVTRWTSQILAELESLPNSQWDLDQIDDCSTVRNK